MTQTKKQISTTDFLKILRKVAQGDREADSVVSELGRNWKYIANRRDSIEEQYEDRGLKNKRGEQLRCPRFRNEPIMADGRGRKPRDYDAEVSILADLDDLDDLDDEGVDDPTELSEE